MYRAGNNRHTTLFVVEVHARLVQRTQTRGVETGKRLARGSHGDSRHDVYRCSVVCVGIGVGVVDSR